MQELKATKKLTLTLTNPIAGKKIRIELSSDDKINAYQWAEQEVEAEVKLTPENKVDLIKLINQVKLFQNALNEIPSLQNHKNLWLVEESIRQIFRDLLEPKLESKKEPIDLTSNSMKIKLLEEEIAQLCEDRIKILDDN